MYFSLNAGYAASNTYSTVDGQGNKRIYLCKVLTGEFTVGQQGMMIPPAKPGQQSHILYDSVVNSISNPGLFTIFNDTQCYPVYLITFKVDGWRPVSPKTSPKHVSAIAMGSTSSKSLCPTNF